MGSKTGEVRLTSSLAHWAGLVEVTLNQSVLILCTVVTLFLTNIMSNNLLCSNIKVFSIDFDLCILKLLMKYLSANWEHVWNKAKKKTCMNGSKNVGGDGK